MKSEFTLIPQNGNTYLYYRDLLFAYIHESKKGSYDIWIEITTRSGFPHDESDFATKAEAIQRAKVQARRFVKRLENT